LPARVALHVPVESAAGRAEHVGCRMPTPRIEVGERLDRLVRQSEKAGSNDARHCILMLLIKWRYLLMFVAALEVSRRKQVRFYAACLLGDIGGGAHTVHVSKGQRALALGYLKGVGRHLLGHICGGIHTVDVSEGQRDLAVGYLKGVGRLPIDILWRIGALAFGGSNAHSIARERAKKQPFKLRLSKERGCYTRDWCDPHSEGRVVAMDTPPPGEDCSGSAIVKIIGIDDLGRPARGYPRGHPSRHRQYHQLACCGLPFTDEEYKAVLADMQASLDEVSAVVQTETSEIHSRAAAARALATAD